MKGTLKYLGEANIQVLLFLPAILFLVVFKWIESYALIALGLAILIQLRQRTRRYWLPMILMFGMYCLEAIGLLYTSEIDKGMKLLEIKAALLVMPIIYALAKPLEQRSVDLLTKFFAITVVIFTLIASGRSWIRFVELGEPSVLVYSELGWYFHPTYLAAYCIFAILILLGTNKADSYRSKTWLRWLLITWLSCFVILLSSKAGIILLPVLLIGACIHLIRIGVKAMNIWPWMVGMAIVTLSVLMFTPRIENRVNEVLNTTQSQDTEGGAKGSTSMRLVAWESSLELMKEHPLGVGSGAVTEKLKEKYEAKGEEKALKKELNSHNQYLQIGVEHGWIGMITLILLVGWAFIFAVRERRFLASAFIFLCAANMMFESYLERQNGIVFFCLFLAIFELERVHLFPKVGKPIENE